MDSLHSSDSSDCTWERTLGRIWKRAQNKSKKKPNKILINWHLKLYEKVVGYLRIRVVPIPIPVSENAADTAEIAGMGISEYASLCTNQVPCYLWAMKQYPATFQSAQLALTDVTDLKSIVICHSTVHGTLSCAATGNYYFWEWQRRTEGKCSIWPLYKSFEGVFKGIHHSYLQANTHTWDRWLIFSGSKKQTFLILICSVCETLNHSIATWNNSVCIWCHL